MLVKEDTTCLFLYHMHLIDANNQQVKSAPDHKQLIKHFF